MRTPHGTFNILLICSLCIFYCGVMLKAPLVQAENKENLNAEPPMVALHLNSEPANLDPHQQKSSSAGYVLDQLYRNLLWLTPSGELKSDLAEQCTRPPRKSKSKSEQLICKLKQNLRWSDGSPLVAEQFVQSYKRILSPHTQSRRADLLFSLKNAKQFFEGSVEFSAVGVQAKDTHTLVFTLDGPAPEFESALLGFYTAPIQSVETVGKVFSGPFVLKDWIKNTNLILEPNKYYVTKTDLLPSVKFYFVPDDSVAVKLYQKNQLQFLRRLPTHLIPEYQKSTEFHSIPIFRFDYLGFGENLMGDLELRKALAHSLPYKELTKLFFSKGNFGCAGLPDRFFETQAPCYAYDLKLAQNAMKKSAWPKNKPLQFIFSTQGGEDHQKMATWMQIQWKKNLRIQIDIKGVESKMYVSKLRTEKQDLFRRGIAPDRVSCSAALENFKTDDSENFLNHFSLNLDTDINRLVGAPTAIAKKQCTAVVQKIMDQYVMIPMGAYEFSILAKPQLQGWSLNQLNQLDLSAVRWVP